MLFEDSEMIINWGERVALVGPNGAGKSTLFKIILKEEEADQGTVDLDEYGMVGYLAQKLETQGRQPFWRSQWGSLRSSGRFSKR